MKTLLIALSLIVSGSAFAGEPLQTAERVCGTIEAGAYDGILSVSLADRASYAGKQVNYAIQNPMDFNWTAGSCVCLSGFTSPDPEYSNDYLYNLIMVGDVQEDGADCTPSIFEGEDIIEEPGIQ